jgi:hypothetical protein
MVHLICATTWKQIAKKTLPAGEDEANVFMQEGGK